MIGFGSPRNRYSGSNSAAVRLRQISQDGHRMLKQRSGPETPRRR